MVGNVTATTDTTAAAAAMKKSMGLNKDDFLQLFITQLKNQDPLNPTDSDKLLSQLSDLSLVEQSYNNNTAMQSLLTAQNNSASMSSVAFIGKNIQANGNLISFDGTNQTSMQFNLGSAADSTAIVITDSTGKTVASSAAGAMSAGVQTLSWDGKDGSGNLLPAGMYSFSVKATKADESIVTATTYTTGKVSGVSYSSGSPMLTIGSAVIKFSDVLNVKGV